MRTFMNAVAAVVMMAAGELGADGAGAGATATALLTSGKKKRKPSVSGDDFLFALAQASKREKKPTAAELAAELGMEKPSFDQRLNALRVTWSNYGFIHDIKNGKSAADLNMTATDYAERVKKVQASDDWTLIDKASDRVGPFPFTLADGRTGGGRTGTGKSVLNMVLAAMMKVDGVTDTESDSETDDEILESEESVE